MKLVILASVMFLLLSCEGVLWDSTPRTVSGNDITIAIENSYYSYFLEIYQLYIEEGHIDNSLTFEDWLLLNGL